MPLGMAGNTAGLVVRGGFGGVLMGLANLVPGISGGTMLLATGVYTRFVEAVAEVTTLRFRFRSLLLLAVVGAAALGAIALLAGPVRDLVVTKRWIMYAVFIGLTLGGVPLVWRLARPFTWSVGAGAAAGFGIMAAITFTDAGGGGADGWLVLFLAGVAGASAMILPGVSGAYLLLVLGQYEAILGAVDQCKEGVAGDRALLWEGLSFLLPVALGVLVGVAGVSNLIRWTLKRYEKATLGVLLGLLFGAVLGIWPFQEAAVLVPVTAGGDNRLGPALGAAARQDEELQRFVATAGTRALAAPPRKVDAALGRRKDAFGIEAVAGNPYPFWRRLEPRDAEQRRKLETVLGQVVRETKGVRLFRDPHAEGAAVLASGSERAVKSALRRIWGEHKIAVAAPAPPLFFFSPSLPQAAPACGLALLAFALTLATDRLRPPRTP